MQKLLSSWKHPWKFAVVFALISLLFLTEAVVTPHLNYALPFVGYGGTFRYASVSIGNASVSLYWLAHGVGAVCTVLLCLRRKGAYQIEGWAAVLTGILLTVFGYVGAKLLYIAENWERVLENGVSLSGVSFFGTVFFMPLVIPLMALALHKPPLAYLDYCTPAGPLMLACIRAGCFMNGCCHGVTCWIAGRPVTLPSQLLECSLDFLLLEVIFRLEAQRGYKGKLYFAFMGGYGVLRFVVEYTRDTAKDILCFSHGQWFSICCMMICAIAILHKN